MIVDGILNSIAVGTILVSMHSQVASLPASERIDILYQLAIAETCVDRKLSRDWALEMYEVATSQLTGPLRAAQRKNALRVLSFSDPDAAASSGEYPYAAMGILLPELAKSELKDARRMFSGAIDHLPNGNLIHRTQNTYLAFLRQCWFFATQRQRKEAVAASLKAIRSWAQTPVMGKDSRFYFEYYLNGETLRIDSEEEAHVFEVLPLVDEVDEKLGAKLRLQYPKLDKVSVPVVGKEVWKSAVFAATGTVSRERIERAIAMQHLTFLAKWAQQDSRRALAIALATKDEKLRRTAMALVMPFVRDQTLLRELNFSALTTGKDEMPFLVALTRANFVLGHEEDAHRIAGYAWKLPSDDFEQLAETCGELGFDDLTSPQISLMARYARGAARNLAGYEEPN